MSSDSNNEEDAYTEIHYAVFAALSQLAPSIVHDVQEKTESWLGRPVNESQIKEVFNSARDDLARSLCGMKHHEVLASRPYAGRTARFVASQNFSRASSPAEHNVAVPVLSVRSHIAPPRPISVIVNKEVVADEANASPIQEKEEDRVETQNFPEQEPNPVLVEHHVETSVSDGVNPEEPPVFEAERIDNIPEDVVPVEKKNKKEEVQTIPAAHQPSPMSSEESLPNTDSLRFPASDFEDNNERIPDSEQTRVMDAARELLPRGEQRNFTIGGEQQTPTPTSVEPEAVNPHIEVQNAGNSRPVVDNASIPAAVQPSEETLPRIVRRRQIGFGSPLTNNSAVTSEEETGSSPQKPISLVRGDSLEEFKRFLARNGHHIPGFELPETSQPSPTAPPRPFGRRALDPPSTDPSLQGVNPVYNGPDTNSVSAFRNTPIGFGGGALAPPSTSHLPDPCQGVNPASNGADTNSVSTFSNMPIFGGRRESTHSGFYRGDELDDFKRQLAANGDHLRTMPSERVGGLSSISQHPASNVPDANPRPFGRANQSAAPFGGAILGESVSSSSKTLEQNSRPEQLADRCHADNAVHGAPIATDVTFNVPAPTVVPAVSLRRTRWVQRTPRGAVPTNNTFTTEEPVAPREQTMNSRPEQLADRRHADTAVPKGPDATDVTFEAPQPAVHAERMGGMNARMSSWLSRATRGSVATNTSFTAEDPVVPRQQQTDNNTTVPSIESSPPGSNGSQFYERAVSTVSNSTNATFDVDENSSFLRRNASFVSEQAMPSDLLASSSSDVLLAPEQASSEVVEQPAAVVDPQPAKKLLAPHRSSVHKPAPAPVPHPEAAENAQKHLANVGDEPFRWAPRAFDPADEYNVRITQVTDPTDFYVAIYEPGTRNDVEAILKHWWKSAKKSEFTVNADDVIEKLPVGITRSPSVVERGIIVSIVSPHTVQVRLIDRGVCEVVQIARLCRLPKKLMSDDHLALAVHCRVEIDSNKFTHDGRALWPRQVMNSMRKAVETRRVYQAFFYEQLGDQFVVNLYIPKYGVDESKSLLHHVNKYLSLWNNEPKSPSGSVTSSASVFGASTVAENEMDMSVDSDGTLEPEHVSSDSNSTLGDLDLDIERLD